MALNKLSDVGGKLSITEITALKAQRDRKEYQNGSGGAEDIFACPVTLTELGGNFCVSPQDIVDAQGPRLPDGPKYTGFWEITKSKARKLAESHGVLLSVTGGFVFEAYRVVDLAGEIPYRQRKVFTVELIQSDELDQYLGFVPGMQQIPLQVH